MRIDVARQSFELLWSFVEIRYLLTQCENITDIKTGFAHIVYHKHYR